MGPPCKIVLLLEGVLKNAKAFIPFAEKTKNRSSRLDKRR